MTLRPEILEHDVITDTVKVRPMTDDELKDYEAINAEYIARQNTPEPSVVEKLASVGLSVTDLKTALGL
jgi:hypothetical protein